MATTAPVYEDRAVSIGRVFNRAFSAIKLNPVVVLGLALLIGALPGILMTYMFVQWGLYSPANLRSGTISFGTIIGTTLFSAIISLIISALVQAALTRATVSAIEGQRATLGESLSSALRVVLPLIGLTILFSLGVGFGFILLLIPGLILLLMWAVAVPALVIEREGVLAAFSRSAELTKGHRWKIFGLFLLLLVIYWLLSLVAGIVGLSTYSATRDLSGMTTANLIGGIVVGTIFNMLWGTIQPSLYVELREAKEGSSIGNLEQVFA